MTADDFDGAALRARLNALGMSQNQLAALLGRSTSSVTGRSAVPAYVRLVLDQQAELRTLRRTLWKRNANEAAVAAAP